jgi:SulP family sulfate permease
MNQRHNGSESAPNGDADHTSPFRPAARKPVLHRVVPVSQELPGYRGGTLRRDLLAGITVAALALPSAMAYAELAGLSPVAGLYALLLPTVAYTLLGSCRQLIVGPEGSVAALVATALVPLAAGDPARYASLAAMLALLVGGAFLLARVVRLGWIADYLSRAVLIGYIHGVAVVLVCGQLGKLLGLDIDAQDPLPQLVEIARELTGLSGATVTVGAACLVLLLVLRWRTPKLPGPLPVVVLAVAASWALGLADRGVAVVGEIPSGLPGLKLPVPHLGDTLDLLPAALGIFLVSFADEILTARTFAGKHGQHVHANQELQAIAKAGSSISPSGPWVSG